MALLMTSDQMIDIAKSAGIQLHDEPTSTANLYTWTDSEGNNLYIGKAASTRRHDDEAYWKTLDHTTKIYSGIVALLSENNAKSRPLRHDPAMFEPGPLQHHVEQEGWAGGAIDSVLERLRQPDGAPTTEEVEQILVRLHIRTGRLIGNSQFASQWESPIGSFSDTVAVLAADVARHSGILPFRTAVATAGVEAVATDQHSDR